MSVVRKRHSREVKLQVVVDALKGGENAGTPHRAMEKTSSAGFPGDMGI
jgi:transposase-like protein